jgi:hypothetical protein
VGVGSFGTPTQLIGVLPLRSYNALDLLIDVNEEERSLIFGLINGLLNGWGLIGWF